MRAVDTGDEWHIESVDGAIVEAAGGAVPTATVEGSAQHVLLSLWGRSVPAGAVVVDGTDPGWLTLGGM